MKVNNIEAELEYKHLIFSNIDNRGKISKIPRDENGNIIGTSWEVIRERMYDNLSKHYGVDLKTL